jgi:hypothetical protein
VATIRATAKVAARVNMRVIVPQYAPWAFDDVVIG